MRLALKRIARAQKKPLSLENGHSSFLLIEENGGHRLEKDVREDEGFGRQNCGFKQPLFAGFWVVWDFWGPFRSFNDHHDL